MPDPPLRYRALRAVVRAVVGLFYRRVAVRGREHVPRDRGGLFVAWHPNGLIDPALVLTSSPVAVVFGARDGLLRWPVVGPLIRALGTVPIYRSVDQGAMSPDERRAANDRSLGALAEAVAGGSFSALFPEGVSHDEPGLAEIRSGAARLYLRARERTPAGRPPPALVPVGLHYEDKDVFRTDVLVVFHPPLAVDGEADPERLTDRIEAALVEAVRPTESWALHALMHRARTLMAAEDAARRGVRAEPETAASREAGFARVWHGYRVRRATHPDETAALRRDTAAYHRQLRALGLDDADLDRPGTGARVLGAALQLAAVAVVLPPLLAVGFAVNAPPYWLLKGLVRWTAKTEKDTATIKLFGAAVLFPAFWVGAAALVGLGTVRLAEVVPGLPSAPLAAGLAVFVLSAVGGVVALLYSEIAVGAWRAVRARVVRWRHAGRLPALREQRAALFDRFAALAEGLPESGGVGDH